MKGIVNESVWCESCDNLHTLVDEGAYCVKCLKFFDAGCLNEIAGEPICFKCSPDHQAYDCNCHNCMAIPERNDGIVYCGDHIVPIGECGCKL
jgi:hypothetical protein